MSPRRKSPSKAGGGSGPVSYDVRVWKIRPHKGKRGTTYAVRWTVAGAEFHDAYRTRALADSRRAELLTATRQGEAFDIETGVPASELSQQNDRSWYEHACEYVDRKWPHVAPKSRQSIADALATVTPTLVTTDRGKPEPKVLREALRTWVFNSPRRHAGPPPKHLAKAVTWLEHNTRPLSALTEPDVLHDALDALSRREDGSPAAPTTIARKRAVLYNALDHAYFEVNPSCG